MPFKCPPICQCCKKKGFLVCIVRWCCRGPLFWAIIARQCPPHGSYKEPASAVCMRRTPFLILSSSFFSLGPSFLAEDFLAPRYRLVERSVSISAGSSWVGPRATEPSTICSILGGTQMTVCLYLLHLIVLGKPFPHTVLVLGWIVLDSPPPPPLT